ncbi:NAD(P)/FAD-dependent oxidoreductase [Cereibacter sphaeroides]|uniref:NAD(P)/FAD-dependent oxidoreductase n=1 Tax=Cereibacter sphaeroides TaxID=1063 RepID=UPI001F371603|nr:NAD(P)/FAD-dependent oxidoreductase [Cereibacter sphaeroides]MCE6952776.1 NAD(P)/FAD-dependent oxidoreductase [Cereibacter sphaeroides]
MEKTDVVILGAGAAGMFCAIEAGRRGRRVLVIDHARAPGEKIRISGGGRCNFTNLGIAPDRFLSRNPRFALSALKRFTQWDFIARLDAEGIAWHEKTLGQLFCDGSATQIVDMLVRQMREAGVTLWLSTEPGEVRRDGGGFVVDTSRGAVSAASVVVATGGKSIPKMGASGYGYHLAESFGLPVVETRPGLVPLTFATQELDLLKPLAGIAVPARVSAGGAAFDEAVLFTHRGLSGPAILQISSYWREGMPVTLRLAQGSEVLQMLRRGRDEQARSAVRTVLAQILPERLARHLEGRAGIEGPLGAQSNATLDRLASLVGAWELRPVGTEGYRTAEVTLGGVDTDHLDARTLQARSIPGLHFIGEAVDVTGWLGGYNFQWAWSSGWAAGQVV